MKYSVALSEKVQTEAMAHLLRVDGQEDLCFGLWRPSHGSKRYSALVEALILPEPGERQVHGNASFNPQYFERALGIALSKGSGLVFMHSHPIPGWQDMSRDDISAENSHAGAVKGATGFPFVGMTMGTDGAWSARFWEKDKSRTFVRHWCSDVRVVGDGLVVTYNDRLAPVLRGGEELTRTISAWGEKAHGNLARLRVGVVGAGSVGCIVAEALARMGISRILLLDFDSVEIVNLDRLLYATRAHADAGIAKVRMLDQVLRHSATASGFELEALEWSVVEEEGYKAALDCDVLFSCVDRPWPRATLNLIAYAHMIPVIDGGLRLEARSENQGLKRADWRAHVAGPGRRCLECLGQYDPGQVSLESEGYLDSPSYIAGLPLDHAARKNENVFGFSLHVAAMEILQFLKLAVPDSGLANIGAQNYHHVTGIMDVDMRSCENNCLHPGYTSLGDHVTISLTGKHVVAESARAKRGVQKKT